jgi:hypothetical protein
MTAKAGESVRPLRGPIDRHHPARQLDAAGWTSGPWL